MKRLLFYIGSITFAIVIAFTSIGLVHYIDNENNKQTVDVAFSSSAEIYNLQQEMNQLYLQKDEFIKEREDLLDKLFIAQSTSDSNIQAIEDLESEISSLYVQKQEYESDKQDIEDAIDELDATNETQAQQIASLQGQLATINSSISDINIQIGALQSQITALQSSNSTISSQITNLTTRIATIESSVFSLDSRIAAIENDISVIYNRLNLLQRNIITLTFDSYYVAASADNVFTFRVHNQVGNKLSLKSDGTGVVISEGVSKVLISYSISSNVATTAERSSRVYLNNSTIQMSFEQFEASKTTTISGDPFLCVVTEGDVISLHYRTSAGSNDWVWGFDNGSLRTYLTIEVIE